MFVPIESAALVSVKFEMNPLDISADNSIRLIAAVKPLRVTYNAVSEIIDIVIGNLLTITM